jgi:SH3-like domain-containing protein
MLRTRAVAVLAILAAFGLAGCGEAQASRCKTKSGFPVPRFVSLKSGEVNARNGPGEDHRILWTWRVRNLPLLVVAESREWRKVRDPQGGTAWVKAQMVDSGRSVMRVRSGDLPLLAEPKPGAKVVAYLRSGAVALQLKNAKGWSRLQAGGEKGWAPEGEVWGGGPEPDCKGVTVPAG